MAFKKFNTLDVIYDDKIFGDIIDANQWNDNFKEIEDVVNSNVADANDNLDKLERTIDGDSGADQIGSTALKVGGAETVQSQLEETLANVEAHKANTTNPHVVTKLQLGLGNADDTSDINKPVSTAHQAALNLKADLASPTFTGEPKVPNIGVGASNQQIANVQYVKDTVVDIGAGDMATAVYDTNNSGVVDNAEKLDGKTAAELIIDNVTSTDTDKGLSANQGKILAEQISGMSAKSTIVTKTLLSSSWTGVSDPYLYNLSVSGVTPTSVQEILPTVDITDTQLEVLQNSNIQDNGQSIDTISLKAWGGKPTIDLPIRIILRGDM